MSQGMRFKGLVGAMDAAAALDALARGVAMGEIRHAPLGDEATPLVLGKAVKLSLKISAAKGKARVSVKLKAAGSEIRKALPPLALGEATGPFLIVGKTKDYALKAKGGTTSASTASLLHGLAAGLAAGRLEIRGTDGDTVLTPGPVLKFSLKSKDGGVELKISWKPEMKGEAAPLPPLFTDAGENEAAVTAAYAATVVERQVAKAPETAAPVEKPAPVAAAPVVAAPVETAPAPQSAVESVAAPAVPAAQPVAKAAPAPQAAAKPAAAPKPAAKPAVKPAAKAAPKAAPKAAAKPAAAKPAAAPKPAAKPAAKAKPKAAPKAKAAPAKKAPAAKTAKAKSQGTQGG